MSSDVIISVQDLTKSYRLFRSPVDRIKQTLALGTRQYYRKFTALDKVSFDVRRGETIGIIGRNGSGKSTLLQTVCGVLKPTAGKVITQGRIAALLELGAGFNPEFSGRENVYFQGAIMGISREKMESRFDEIARFADIGEFIDQPVKTYSSGMFVRLAFAVAISVDCEILIVDEALGVGDMEFQERSITRMREMIKQGTTILFVSHSLPMIRNFCSRVIWLQNGRLKMDGPSSEVCLAYQNQMDERVGANDGKLSQAENEIDVNRIFHKSGNKKTAAIKSVEVSNDSVKVGDMLSLSVSMHVPDTSALPRGYGLGVLVHDVDGKLTAVFNSIRDDLVFTSSKETVSLILPRIAFVPGKYWLSVNICDENGLFAYDSYDHCISFNVIQEFSLAGIPKWEGEVACEHLWN